MAKNNKTTIRDIFLVIGGVIFVLSGLFFIGEINSNTNNKQYKGTVAMKDGVKNVYSNDFEIIKNETKGERQENGTYKIKGKIKQNVDGNFTGIFITIILLDKNGNKVRETTGLQYSNYLGNKIWEFSVSGNDADGVVTDFKLDNCYGY